MTKNSSFRSASEKRLSLSLKKPNRFDACVTEEQQSIAAKGIVNTKVANDWALRNLRQWVDRGRNCGEEQVPGDLLQDLLLTVCFVCFQLYNCFLFVFIVIFNGILH